MIRVNINGANHQVEVQDDGTQDLDAVIAQTRKLWDDTRHASAGPPGPASAGQSIGFKPDQTGWADLREGEPMPVRAEVAR